MQGYNAKFCEEWFSCEGCTSLGSVTMSSSAYEKTSALCGVMVPSLTANGNFFPVDSKCLTAAPFPPLPSQFCSAIFLTAGAKTCYLPRFADGLDFLLGDRQACPSQTLLLVSFDKS